MDASITAADPDTINALLARRFEDRFEFVWFACRLRFNFGMRAQKLIDLFGVASFAGIRVGDDPGFFHIRSKRTSVENQQQLKAIFSPRFGGLN